MVCKITSYESIDLSRYNATDDDIKRAYRKIVLKHHPDKRKAQGENVCTDDDYFTCITKAYETLGKFMRLFGHIMLEHVL